MADLSVQVVRTPPELAALAPAWATLHAQGCPNPFAHPAWLLPWAARWVAPGALRVLAVRRGEELVAVAPLHEDRGLRGTRVLRALGTGPESALVELPQIVTGTDPRRAVRAVVAWAWERADALSWIELPLAPDQGWVEPAWLAGGPDGPGTVVHKAVRACVVEPLPDTVEAWHATRKRNLRESLRRARNRLGRTGLPWSVEVHEGPDAVAALPTLLALHAARAALPGKVHHPGRFDDPAAAAFLRDAVAGLAAAGAVELHVLRVGDDPAAARLVLRAPGAIYLAWSGVAPQWWELSGVTLLTATAIERAIARGDRVANVGAGPDTAKLRFSERLEVHHEFLIGGTGRAARMTFGAYLGARALADLRRARAAVRTVPAA